MQPTVIEEETAFNWDAPLVTTLDYSELRLQFSPKQWRTYVTQNCPELDPAEEYRIRFEEDRLRFYHGLEQRRKACKLHTIEMIKNPATGDTHAKIIRCGCPNCEVCGPHEYGLLLGEIQKGLEGREVRLVRTEDRAKMVRKYGKEKIKAFPVELDSGRVVYDLLIETTDNIGYPYKEVQKDDVEKWLRPVYGHKRSGDLFKSAKPSTPIEPQEENPFDPPIEAVTQNLLVDFNGCNAKNQTNMSNLMWAQLVIDLAILETSDLRPINPHSLTEALNLRREAEERWIEKLGGVIFAVDYRKTVLHESELDWSKSAERVKNKESELERWLKMIE